MGIFGPENWLEKNGILTVLAPWLICADSLLPWQQFRLLPGKQAAELSQRLPQRYMATQHHRAPPLGKILNVSAQYTNIFLGGYVIHSPMPDESVHVTSMTLCLPQSFLSSLTHKQQEKYDDVWFHICAYSGFPVFMYSHIPDEITTHTHSHHKEVRIWNIWWD
ncbi:hypothetical protein [Schaalia sp. lx-100]|uniref:hypothetical protein n=1 Tax=Schaalia sp. lx-100 TaxID=2899081 RepID=UPI001E2FBA84|nr:hypothetical protein [Schaalia sp. lx-100]MCD4558069.1 hypothetical protein [Schaalia sp. lx-100]